MIYHIRNAVKDNISNGFHPLKCSPSPHCVVGVGLVHLPRSKRQDQQVVHSLYPRKLQLVMQHVSDGGCCGIVHHNPAIHSGTRRVAVHGSHVSGFEQGRHGSSGSTYFPQVEIPRLILQSVGPGKQKRSCSGEIVTGDEHWLHCISQCQRSSVAYQVLFQQCLQALAGESGAHKPPQSGPHSWCRKKLVEEDTPSFLGNQLPSLLRCEQGPIVCIARTKHGCQNTAYTSPGNNIKIVSNASFRVATLALQKLLQVRQHTRWYDTPQHSAASINTENTNLASLSSSSSTLP